MISIYMTAGQRIIDQMRASILRLIYPVIASTQPQDVSQEHKVS